MSTFTQALALVGERVISTLKHPTRRNIVYMMAIVWINAINIFVFYHRHEALRMLTSTINDVAPINNYKGHAIPRKMIENIVFKMWAKKDSLEIDPRHLDSHSTVYNTFFANHEHTSILELSYIDRCDAYFRTLYTELPLWNLDTSSNFEINMEYQMEWQKYKDKYIDWAVEALAAEKHVNKDSIDRGGDEVHKKIAKVFDGLKAQAANDESDMRDYVSHLRVFSRCFVDREDSNGFQNQANFIQRQHLELAHLATPFKATDDEEQLGPSAFDSCRDLHLKMFPWMAGSYPLYERHDGTIVRKPPNMSKYVEAHIVDAHQPRGKGAKAPVHLQLTNDKQCWMGEFRSKLSGRGLVIPFGDNVEATINLILILRALGNRYPIELVHFGALSKESRDKLVDAARRPFTDFPASFSRVEDLLPKLSFDKDTQGFLAQELWFVDAKTMVAPHYYKSMEAVPITAMAGFVNSFEEYVMIHPEAVPMQNPSYFFDLPEYSTSGAYFYRARPWHTRRHEDPQYFNRMTPSLVDATMFDIPLINEEVLDLDFFNGLAEYQDLRVMVVNRNKHFLLILMHLELSMFYPANYRGNDGSEVWLAFVVNGDLDFHFNAIMPAAVGKTTDPSLRLKDDKLKRDSAEICSSQVGHLDPLSGKRLAWMGSGFKGCMASIDFDKEITSAAWPWRHIVDKDDLRNYYNDRVTLEEAVVPPYKDVTSLKLRNSDKEPELPWTNYGGCDSQFFCGYSRIGGRHDNEDLTMRSLVLQFDRKDIELYNFYGDIWVGSD